MGPPSEEGKTVVRRNGGSGDRPLTGVVILLAGLVFTALTGISALNLWNDLKTAEEWAEHEVSLQAQVLTEHASRSFDAVDLTLLRVVEQLKRDRAGQPRVATTVTESLQQQVDLIPQLRTLIVVSAAGFVEASNMEKSVGIDVQDRAYFRVLKEEPDHGLYVGRPLKGRTTGKWFLSVARRIDKPDGTFDGLALAVVDKDYFERVYQAGETTENLSSAMITSAGEIFAASPGFGPAGETVTGLSVADQPAFKTEIAIKPRGLLSKQLLAGAPKSVSSFAKVEGIPIFIVSSIPRHVVMKTWWVHVQDVVLLVVGTGLLVAVLTVFVVNQMKRRSLAEATLRSAYEEMEQRVIERTHTLSTEIQERQKAERDSRELLRFQQVILDAIPTPIFQKDTRGIYQGCNRAFAQMMGRERHQIIGKSVFDLSPRQLAETYVTADRELLENPGTQTYEGIVATGTGEQRHVIFHKATFEDGEGNVAGLVGVVFDITERKSAEQALRESEERVRLLMESTGEGIYGVDKKGMFTFCNPAGLKILGYGNVDELVGRHAHSMIHHSYADGSVYPQQECLAYQAYRTGIPTYCDTEVFWRKNRTAVEVEYRSFPMMRDDEIMGTVVSFSDISERKRVEHELRENEAKLRAVLESTTDLIYMKDMTGHYIYINPEGARFFGLPAREIIGKTDHDLFPEETASQIRETDQWVLESRRPRIFGETLESRGNKRAFLTNKTLLREKGGKVFGIAGISHDISDLKKVEASLRESEERYRALVELSPDAILVLADGALVFANVSAVSIFGANTESELLGKKVAEMFQPPNETTDPFTTTNAGEQVLLRIDGTPFDAEITSAPVLYEGRSATQVVVRDVTERKQVQRELIHAGKLATLGEMAAGISHELSQPLNIIKLFAEGTLQGLQEGDEGSPELRKSLSVIDEQAGRMGRIIEHMRVYGRKEDEGAEVFHPCDAIKQAIELVREQYHLDGIEIEYVHPDPCYAASGNAIQFEQVILNFLANARDAITALGSDSGKRSEGVIRIDHVDDDKAGVSTIRISDSGGGIPDELLESVFEPFFTTKEAGRGTGLGLSISYGIITAMGGGITVRNTDTGAEFAITVPTSPTMSADPRGGATGTEKGEGTGDLPRDRFHIFVVDDEPLAKEAVTSHLTALGYRISSFSDGQEALDGYLEDPADLLITDIRMPNMDGHELVEALHNYDSELPVIITTGHMGYQEEAEKREESPNLVVIKKPIGLATLVEKVEMLLHLQ